MSNSDNNSSYLAIGVIMGAHGLRGDLRVRPFNPDSVLFTKGRRLFISEGNSFTSHEIQFSTTGKKGLRLHLSGVNDVDAAKRLFKKEVFALRSDMPELDDGEYYLSDVVGYRMIDSENGNDYGEIIGIMETGANDIFVVKLNDRELLVPVVEGVVEEIDHDTQRLSVVLPEGLLEIYED